MIGCSQLSRGVLEGIDLEVEGEEFIVIAGPPGSGKSTLLSVLAGYLTPTTGTVTVLGRSLFGMNATQRAKFRRLNIGVVFQKGHLISQLTVLENVTLPLLGEKNAEEKGLSALAYMGVEGKKNLYPEELSGAEAQLVALSRALINQPRILFLDEPTQFLDHHTGMKVMTYLRQMALDHQMTIVAVLNDVRLFPFASRIIRMKGGKITDVLGESFVDSPFLRI